jgi:Winged helix DNA-binding domain
VAERVLAVRELNRALLTRQLLLRRARLRVPRAIERVGALQAQWPPSPYIALWSRLEGFSREQLMRAVESRRVVKATLMRTTLHLVSADDYLAYAGVFLRRRSAEIEAQLARHSFDEDADEVARRLALHVTEPRSRPELLDLLGRPRLVVDERMPWLVWHLLTAKAGLIHGPSSVVWRKHTSGGKHVSGASWLGRPPADGPAAAARLVARYLAAFGPATRADAAQWTGLPVSELEAAFGSLRLRTFRDGRGRRLLDVARAPLPHPATEAQPRFLPMWDSTLLAHADRSRILPEEYRKVVIRKNGDVQATFLVDGFVAGTWSLEGDRVELAPFEPLRRDVRRALDAEGRALARFHL